MSFLNIRAIINGKEIYPLPGNKPIAIGLDENNAKVVITDGYHFTPPLELVYHHIHTYYFKVVCAIDDFQLAAGCAFIFITYIIGMFSGIFFLKAISFFPIFYFLFLFYINKKEFLQLRVT